MATHPHRTSQMQMPQVVAGVQMSLACLSLRTLGRLRADSVYLKVLNLEDTTKRFSAFAIEKITSESTAFGRWQ